MARPSLLRTVLPALLLATAGWGPAPAKAGAPAQPSAPSRTAAPARTAATPRKGVAGPRTRTLQQSAPSPGTPPQAASPGADVRNGRATYYDATGLGACSLAKEETGPRLVAAVSRERFARSAACGTCAEVRGPRGVVRVRITDVCPGCRGDDLDLSREAFARVADVGAGRVGVDWQPVPCEVQGPLRYRFTEDSTRWWSAVQVQNHRQPVRSLAWWKDGRWVELARRGDNHFVTRAAPGEGPVRLRVTAADGQTREDTLPGVRAGRTLAGGRQFD